MFFFVDAFCRVAFQTLSIGCLRYVLVYNRLTNDATTLGLGGLVVECDDCGPCGLNSVLVTNLTAGK